MNNPEKFEELIKKRQECTECNDTNLCQFECVIKDGPNVLGLWDPFKSNSDYAEILIVGQDFSDRSYLEKAKNINGVLEQEAKNPTNLKLRGYLEKSGLLNKKLYFTNAVLCIKNGETKVTKKGSSMSTPIKRKWCINCSRNFLEPLIRLDNMEPLTA
jgi:uracil-DNA glycosylase